MKNLRDMLIVVAVGATLLFPGQSNGELFRRLKARRAARVVYNGSPQTCVGPGCDTPTGGGLTTNRKGGFEGQLPDSTYADYLANQTPQKPLEPTPVETVAETAELSIVVKTERESTSLEAALEGVELAEAKTIAERAVVEAKRLAEQQALEIKQQIEQLKLDFSNQIDDLQEKQAALEPATDD